MEDEYSERPHIYHNFVLICLFQIAVEIMLLPSILTSQDHNLPSIPETVLDLQCLYSEFYIFYSLIYSC